MKKIWLLLSVSTLVAEEDFSIVKQRDSLEISIPTKGNCPPETFVKQETCRVQTSCDPCCDPCASYCCRWGAVLDVEFLYWYAGENHLPIVTEVKNRDFGNLGGTIPIRLITPQKDRLMDASWDPGFRVGIGWESCFSDWSTFFKWTYMHNQNKKKIPLSSYRQQPGTELPAVGTKALISPWVYDVVPGVTLGVTFLFDLGTFFSRVIAHWELDYNIPDIEFARNWTLNDCFHFQSQFGLRAAWTKIQYNLKQDNPLDSTIPENFVTEYTNRFWGIGFRLGIDPVWYFCNCMGLYGKFSASILWGQYEDKRKESFVTTSDIGASLPGSYRTKRDQYAMQSIFDVGIGLRYQTDLCSGRYDLLFDLGWEHNLWINFVHRMQIADINIDTASTPAQQAFFRRIDNVVTDLGLGGFVLRAQFGF